MGELRIMSGGLEVRLEEVERDVLQVKKDVGQINIDMALLAQRQEGNAKAIANLNTTINANHTAQMQLMTQIAETGNQASGKLGYIKGSVAILAIFTIGGGGAAVTVGNDSVIGFLRMIAGLIT